jgi:hypothetical protein
MPKGGPLAFLNKKTWHPGRIQNQEKVWLKEQEAAKEQQKLEDLKKQIEEERAREELEALAQSAGVKKREEKLDWMYQGGVGAKFEANQRTDAVDVVKEENVPSRMGEEERRVLPSFYEQDDPSSANEIWQRLHGDPLMIMKQQELQARRSIVSNPVKMDAIKKKVDEKYEKERRRKRERKHRHHRDEEDGERHRRKERKERHTRERHSERSRDRDERRGRGRDQSSRDGRRDRREDHLEERPSGYGISFAATAPDAVRHRDRSNVIEENRARLEEAARRKSEEEKAERDRHRRHKHRTGSLTEEEKQRRLQEMTDAANHVDTMRNKRVAEYETQVTREDSEYHSAHRNSSRDFVTKEARARLEHRLT